MEYMVAAYTDKGIQKETNQDSFCIRRAMIPNVGETLMAVVCDGMGGLKKGEVASASCVTAFGKWFDNNFRRFMKICGNDFSAVRSQWTAILEALHISLLEYASDNKVQLGTTVTAIFTYGDRYLTVNIGDSRIYERKNTMRQLTQDQSLVAREVALGHITDDESRHHPQRNMLPQCLGTGAGVSPVFTEGKLQHGALYLLCSDGFVHEMSDEELSEHTKPFALNSRETLTKELIDMTELCKQRGEKDNITAILFKSQESVYKNSESGGLKKLLKKLRISSCTDDTANAEAIMIETAQIIHTQEVIGQINIEQAW